MDEVENPQLPAAGEKSPTIRPTDQDDPHDGRDTQEPSLDITAQTFLTDADDSSPTEPPLALPTRPGLKRGSSAPLPPQPPPDRPPLDSDTAPDSLTFADLKRIRSTFPDAQVPQKQPVNDCDRVYDFRYADAQSLGVEVDEWFGYGEDERVRLRRCRAAFHEEWKEQEWLAVAEDTRRSFIGDQLSVLRDQEASPTAKTHALMVLTYIVLGVWEETAGRPSSIALEDLFPDSKFPGSRLDDYSPSSLQIQWIVAMVDTVHACDGLVPIYHAMRAVCEEGFKSDHSRGRCGEGVDLWCCLTLMYVFLEVSRTTSGERGAPLRRDIGALEPKLLNHLTKAVANIRLDEHVPVQLPRLLLLLWKAILVCIGGIADVDRVKKSLREHSKELDARGQPVITASPLDYHLFRQEITSKYPAYQPPPPLFPLEPENNTFLPPLKHRRPSHVASEVSAVDTSSIMHQPVHIATPAPSPPPSPASAGKTGKKQNYQTNQMFPFLYPPLDRNSNDLGGKGSTELQDVLVGQKWTGSDIPTSILEAAELFAKRMRATRAMKQMWEARVEFMKFERGWKPTDDNDPVGEDDFELVPSTSERETAEQGRPLSDEQKRLDIVSQYYHDALPHLQSVVIVLLKVVLQSVTDMVARSGGSNGPHEPTSAIVSAKPIENGVVHHPPQVVAESTAEELDRLRSQEITAKALGGILLLLLKWFKVSHTLQYEFLTQLLLDSNYVPVVLRLWQTQEIARACHYQLDRDELGFFHFCRLHSRHPPPQPPRPDPSSDEVDSEDEALPSAIKRTREDATTADRPVSPTATSSPPSHDCDYPPEVDELGYPATPMPDTPITSYSYRNIHTAIHHLRVLHKITRRKTHRALLLVSYKSSTHLKKTVRVPVRELRYYTLKLFKSQVPFCGRKWRQANMKIITAVWLAVPAALRDDWLSGGGGGMGGVGVGDVDGAVDDAVALEESLRKLTHWWNLRQCPAGMGLAPDEARALLEEESDFFCRQLARLDEGSLGEGDDEAGGEEAGAEDGLGYSQGWQTPASGWQGPIEGY